MNTDIRIKVGQPDHIKTKKLIQIAGEESYRCLIRLWTKIAQDHPEGMTEISRNDIELIADWQGETGTLAAALVDSGYFEQCDNGLIPHDWQEHQQWVIGAAERSERAKRNAATGWKKRRETINAIGMPASSQHQASINAPILSSPILTLPNQKSKKEISEKKETNTKEDAEFQKLAAMWRDMSRSKNNGWPKEDVWAKIKFRWLTQIKLLLTRDGFTKDQFVAVIKAFHSGALDSGDFVWARDAVKSPAKLRQPDKDGMVYMQVVLNRLAAIKIIPGLSPLRSFEDKYASDIYGLNSNRKGGAITEKVFQQSMSQLREKYNNWHRVESQGRYK